MGRYMSLFVVMDSNGSNESNGSFLVLVSLYGREGIRKGLMDYSYGFFLWIRKGRNG